MARIAGINIPTGKRVVVALTYIHGIGHTSSREICTSVGIPPERRVNDLTDEDTNLVGKMFQTAKDMALKLGIDKSGYRTIFNCNEDGGQTVYHIHLHFIGGRSLGWPPG